MNLSPTLNSDYAYKKRDIREYRIPPTLGGCCEAQCPIIRNIVWEVLRSVSKEVMKNGRSSELLLESENNTHQWKLFSSSKILVIES